MTFDLDLKWRLLHPGNSQWLRRVSFETRDIVARSSVSRSKCPECTITSKGTTICNIRYHSRWEKLYVFTQRLKRLQNNTHWAVAYLYWNRLQKYHHPPDLIDALPLNKPNFLQEERLTQTGSPILCISQFQQYPLPPPGNSWAFARIVNPEVGVYLLCCPHVRAFDQLICPPNPHIFTLWIKGWPREGVGH